MNLTPDTSPSEDHNARWLQLLIDVSVIANRTAALQSGLSETMRRVCSHNGWMVGYCDVREENLKRWSVAYDVDTEAEEVPGVVKELARNWIDRVMTDGCTRFVNDFRDRSKLDAPKIGAEPRTGGAIVTPLRTAPRLVGGLVFYSGTPLCTPVDEQWLERLRLVIDNIGNQMGHFVERWCLFRRFTEEVESEREELGREIHDTLAQQLVGVALLASNLRKQSGTQSAALEQKWDLLIDNLVKARTQSRALASGLSASAVTSNTNDLVIQLEDLAESVRVGHEIDCLVECQGSFSGIDSVERKQLWRIAREATFNALRHASPTRITIRLRQTGSRRTLEVIDDGPGFSPTDSPPGGLGLASMHYRAALAGGRLEVESANGEGTVIRCVVDAR